ncbi:MAG TPA: hypothetical protein VH079_14395 [Terriglobales bacterium]|jgi:hypothetical protein|nr:hypothetical protein [Terriglobales bacterium]
MKSADVTPQREESENRTTTTDTVINAVARTVGATLGTIAGGTAKVLGHSVAADPVGKTRKTKSQVSEEAPSSRGIEFQKRRSRYKRKKDRHAQKLRRSHTKG